MYSFTYCLLNKKRRFYTKSTRCLYTCHELLIHQTVVWSFPKFGSTGKTNSFDCGSDFHERSVQISRLTETPRPCKYLLRWLKTVSSTFHDVDFDGSQLPLSINWCYNHGIKKLPSHWWTRWYYFRSTIGYHSNIMTHLITLNYSFRGL